MNNMLEKIVRLKKTTMSPLQYSYLEGAQKVLEWSLECNDEPFLREDDNDEYS